MLFSVFFKLYFLSFIENKIGFWNTLHFYLLQGLGGAIFSAFISDESGANGSVGVAVHIYSL